MYPYSQDIDLFRKWTWNNTMEISGSYLTGVGYEELYDIGYRIRQTYPELLTGTGEDYYFRSTNEQRTVTSGIAYMHGLTDGINLNVVADEIRDRDDVIRVSIPSVLTLKEGFKINEMKNTYMGWMKIIGVNNMLKRPAIIISRMMYL